MNKKGLDHIVVLVHKIYTISIPKPDDTEEWIGDSVEVGQEIRCCISQINNKSKPPFIRATLNSDYLQGCRLSDSIIIHNMENVIESDNLNSTIKIEKTNDEISENNTISEKEKKKHRKKHKKLYDIDTFKNIKYEENINTDSTIEGLNENSMIENSINEDDTVSDEEKKKHRKKHKKSREIALESFSTNQTKAESSNNTENDTYRYIKHEINGNTDNVIKDQNLNSVKIDTSTNQTLENDIISEKEKRKSQKKHRKSHASDLESIFEDKKGIILNSNTENNNTHINIKCEDNTNSAIESHNLKYLNSNIKIDSSMNGISDDTFSDREKKKFRKKHKKSREIDTESISENKDEIKLNYNTDSNINKNIQCEDNIHNTNNAIENHNLERVIKIENLTSGISEEITFDREKTKHRKKRKRSRETDTETETASDYLEKCKKRKKTSTSPDLKTYVKIKTEKFDSDLELKSPIKIKVEKV